MFVVIVHFWIVYCVGSPTPSSLIYEYRYINILHVLFQLLIIYLFCISYCTSPKLLDHLQTSSLVH